MNYSFADGNRRIGHAAMETFLVMNGFELVADVNEAEKVILTLATGNLSREELHGGLRLTTTGLRLPESVSNLPAAPMGRFRNFATEKAALRCQEHCEPVRENRKQGPPDDAEMHAPPRFFTCSETRHPHRIAESEEAMPGSTLGGH